MYGTIEGPGDEFWQAVDSLRGDQSWHMGTMCGAVDGPGDRL